MVIVNDLVPVAMVDDAIFMALGLLVSKIVHFTFVFKQIFVSLVLPIN